MKYEQFIDNKFGFLGNDFLEEIQNRTSIVQIK